MYFFLVVVFFTIFWIWRVYVWF